MLLALGDGQAIGVRAQPAGEQRVAIDGDVLRRDGRGDVRPRARHEQRRLLGRDMLQHDPQLRIIVQQRAQDAVDEHRLAVEDIDVGIGDLAMNQQRHADALHRLQHLDQRENVGDAVRAVGGGVGRIELARRPHALGEAARDLIRVGPVGQVAGHQRGEVDTAWRRCPNSVAIGSGRIHAGHRRGQVGHHDRSPEPARGKWGHRGQHRAIAQVNMPVVGAADGDAVDHKRRGLAASAGYRQRLGTKRRDTYMRR